MIVLLGILLFWLLVNSIILWKTKNHYNQLIKGTSKTTLSEVLGSIINKQKQISDQQSQIEKELTNIKSELISNIQKIGVIRFNPFSDTGGSQSFTIAMLDGENNGIVMTSLYARTGNRWYIKHIQKGNGVGVELSKEEQSAIIKSKKVNEMKG
jgi:hypothetical protein